MTSKTAILAAAVGSPCAFSRTCVLGRDSSSEKVRR